MKISGFSVCVTWRDLICKTYIAAYGAVRCAGWSSKLRDLIMKYSCRGVSGCAGVRIRVTPVSRIIIFAEMQERYSTKWANLCTGFIYHGSYNSSRSRQGNGFKRGSPVLSRKNTIILIFRSHRVARNYAAGRNFAFAARAWWRYQNFIPEIRYPR